METSDINLEIKKCIKNAHKFSEGLGKSTSIRKDYIVNSLSDISEIEINLALFKMKKNGEIEFNANDPAVILLTDNYKQE